MPADDIECVRDLGLVAADSPLAIANPIYREVIPRELTRSTQEMLAQDPTWYVDARKSRKTVIECKLLRESLKATVRTGLEQTRAYMDRCAADAGHLVVFDRAGGKSWDQKVFRREEDTGGARITIWGM
ncbi:MAG: hypothetical protein OXF93_00970 [Acidobacteria bacterium]|nr:hypothetical protein [Acidobacteriota bacterium]